MALNRDRRPMSRSLVRAATQDGDYAPPAEAMRVPWRQAELAELERVLRSAMTGALMDAASQMLVASAQRIFARIGPRSRTPAPGSRVDLSCLLPATGSTCRVYF
jgi:hypothetical protein